MSGIDDPFDYDCLDLNPDGTPRTPGRSVEHLIRFTGLKMEISEAEELFDGFKEPDVPLPRKPPNPKKSSVDKENIDTKGNKVLSSPTTKKKDKKEPKPKPATVTSKKPTATATITSTLSAVPTIPIVAPSVKPEEDFGYKNSTTAETWDKICYPFKSIENVPRIVRPKAPDPPEMTQHQKQLAARTVKQEVFDDFFSAAMAQNAGTQPTEPKFANPKKRPTPSVVRPQSNICTSSFGVRTKPYRNLNNTFPRPPFSGSGRTATVNQWSDPSLVIKEEFPNTVEYDKAQNNYLLSTLPDFSKLEVKAEQDVKSEPPVLSIPSPAYKSDYGFNCLEYIKAESDSKIAIVKPTVVPAPTGSTRGRGRGTATGSRGALNPNPRKKKPKRRCRAEDVYEESEFTLEEPRSKFCRDVTMLDGQNVKCTFVGSKGVRFPDEVNTDEINNFHEYFQETLASKITELAKFTADKMKQYNALKKEQEKSQR